LDYTDVAVVVPARLASTRLPEKLLAPVHGRPVLAWTLASLRQLPLPRGRVFVATGDAALADVARAEGVGVLETPGPLPSGSHRVAVASRDLPEAVRWVVNVQGDEPLMTVETVVRVLQARRDDTDLVTAGCRLTAAEWRTPSTVKALVDQTGRALWFSRAPLPHRLAEASDDVVAGFLERSPGVRRHLGIYAFRRARLADWLALPGCAVSEAAGLEQLAALLQGWTVRVADVARPRGPAVDTAVDLEAVRAVLGAPSACFAGTSP